MEKSTKVIVLGGVVAMGLTAGTANALSVAANATGTLGTWSVTAGNFVQNAFTFKLSNNVALIALDSPTAVAVSTASTKGTRAFGGSSNGGGVRDCDGSSVATPAPKAATATGDGCS
ncbi:hypothetical protein [Parachitinimonas caeni]|uniref:Uncharacterized protein n=1 Tax=Parachitinimonas caeni TaxID=3031301 RepID=A0ABT7DT61_9NEIS|nr:hypothetical protein [Parachitinimonas caeni]MDK2123221.1 hypothetical protein [Parachitinimonas caeni]